jgi:hypothetical protein
MRNVWSVSAILLATVLAGCAGTPETTQSFDEVTAPVWHAGDAYAYNVTGLVGGGVTMTIDGETATDSNAELQVPDQTMLVYEVLNANFDGTAITAARFADGFQFSLMGQSFSGSGKLPLAFRHDTLSPSAVEISQTQVCDPGCRLATTGFDVQDPVLDPYLAFPLTPGKTWRNDLPLPGEFAKYGAYINLDAVVIGLEQVEGPNGTVDAIRIERTITFPFDDAFLAFMAGQSGAGMENVEVHTDVAGMVVSHYAPSIGNIVRETAVMDVSLDLEFTQDGRHYEMQAGAMMDIVSYLAGFVAGHAADFEGQALYDRFDNGMAVADPTGANTTGYDIRITPDRSDFNVADGGQVNFDIATVPALRDGDIIRYSLINGRESPLDVGSGDAFNATFTEAGLYGVYVQITNEAGAIQGLGQTFVPVDFMGEIELLCGHASSSNVPNMGTCGAASVPLFNSIGLQAVTIEAAGDVAAAQGGQLKVTDASGNVATAAANGGTGSLSLAELGELVINAKGWDATWTADAAAEPTMTIKMVLDYAVPVASE